MTDSVNPDRSDVWEAVLKILGEELNPRSFQNWFTSTKLISATESAIVVEAPNKFSRDWLVDHYYDVILSAVERAAGKKLDMEIVSPSEQARIEAATRRQKFASQEEPQSAENTRAQTPALAPQKSHPYLNLKYTFDSFVVGSSNRFAHAAALAISQSPAKAYNPLFIYGGVGLGKTHLLQAIGHYISENSPNANILYISSEKFTNQLINAIQHRTTVKFRQVYRNMDVLLIDDIHFIAGRESTQEEFFHTFNTLYDAHKQIVLSSDRPPKEIHALEDRLVSRFEWGLVTDIQPPDLETRIAILRKKAEKETIKVPEDVAFFIAEKIKTNIRELEGALIRVVANAKLTGRDLTLDLTKEVLRDMLTEERQRVTIDLIQKKVAEYFDVRLSDMKTKRRTRVLSHPRQVAMYLCREMTDYSFPEIGEHFGGRDHTTVLHAHDKLRTDLKANRVLKEVVDKLVDNITKGSD